jgi:hypothetical protein
LLKSTHTNPVGIKSSSPANATQTFYSLVIGEN